MGEGRDTSHHGKRKASSPPRPSMGVENREDVKLWEAVAWGKVCEILL
jgi:hypothetical protein